MQALDFKKIVRFVGTAIRGILNTAKGKTMTKEDLKFRYYNGENECPIDSDPYKDGPYVLRTFWDIERYVSRKYTISAIEKIFRELYIDGSSFCPDSLRTLDIGDGEKAVFLACCQIVDTNHPGADNELVDLYFNNGSPHILDIA